MKKTDHILNIDYLQISRKMEIRMSESLNVCAQSTSCVPNMNENTTTNPTRRAIIEKDGAKLTAFLSSCLLVCVNFFIIFN